MMRMMMNDLFLKQFESGFFSFFLNDFSSSLSEPLQTSLHLFLLLSCYFPFCLTLSFFLEIRSPWTQPKLFFSWWQRRACPVCPPAWGRSIPATVTLTASSTSPMPHRRCSGLHNQQRGHPAEPEADKTNWNTTNTGKDDCQTELSRLFLSSFLASNC